MNTPAAPSQMPLLTSFKRGDGTEVALRVFGKKPQGTEAPLVIYFHGGLFNCGKVEDAEGIAQLIAEDAVVVCVDYPLAPKLHFPATVELAYESLTWAKTYAAKLGASRKRIIVAGDQAGGNLAAAVAMMARDRGLMKKGGLRAQVLVNPLLDPQQSSLSMQAAEDCPCRQAWADYLPVASDAMHPYAAPLRSKRLNGLASALVITADEDPLRDEAEQYAARLIAAGVPVQVRRLKAPKGSLANPASCCFNDTADMVRQFVADT